jgi:hypothetical protein
MSSKRDGDNKPAGEATGDGARQRKEQEADLRGNRDGDPQRGGRLPDSDVDTGDEPRPADDSARSGIPSRSFNL